MSSIVKKRVNLEFINTGLQVEDIAVEDENQTLGEFIENTLMRLEVNYSTKACNNSIDKNSVLALPLLKFVVEWED